MSLFGHSVFPCRQGPFVWSILHTNTISSQAAILSHLLVVLTIPFGEPPLVRDKNLERKGENIDKEYFPPSEVKIDLGPSP